jgi:hypothetical protein
MGSLYMGEISLVQIVGLYYTVIEMHMDVSVLC